MGFRRLLTLLLIAAGISTLVATGCGGGSSSDSSGASSAADTTAASNGESGKGDAKDEFGVPGEKNEFVEFGKEASESEREAASVVLEENLDARASHDWAAQCASLNALGVKAIEENPKNKGKTCAQVLSVEGKQAPESILENTLEGEIDELRVKGAKAFALWHGSGGKDYAMAMENENGQWKVATLVTTTLPKPEPKSKSKAKSNSEAKPSTPSSSG